MTSQDKESISATNEVRKSNAVGECLFEIKFAASYVSAGADVQAVPGPEVHPERSILVAIENVRRVDGAQNLPGCRVHHRRRAV